MDNNAYLKSFGDVSLLQRTTLLREMDNVWDELGLNNINITHQEQPLLTKFYSHPVWTLNGLFSEADVQSRQHRELLAEYIAKISPDSVADYGGGSGVLARFIADKCPINTIDIIEPYPSQLFVDLMEPYPSIKYCDDLKQLYDVIIAQDVLEHVNNPIEIAIHLIESTHTGGIIVFANCFYPEIKCHLPSTFYLRHTFKKLISFAGLEFVERIDNATHILVFKKIKSCNIYSLKFANFFAKIIGNTLNAYEAFKKNHENRNS